MATYPISGGICFLNGTYNGLTTANASITSIPGFPNTFSGASNANLMVNTAANAVTFVSPTTLALVLNAQNAQTLTASVTTQIKWDTNTIGSLAYSNTHGDVTIPQTGFYILSANLAITAATAGEVWSIGISDGAGAMTTALVNMDTDATSTLENITTVAYLTAGTTVGCFFTETTAAGKTGGSALTTNFCIKLIA